MEKDPSTSRDDPETQVFKSEETGDARFGFCCYCFGLVWLLLFVYLKTVHQSFSFPTKFFDSTLECALQLSIFLRKIIDNNIFSFLSSLGSLCSFLAPKENTLHQLYLYYLLQRFWPKFCKVHELRVGMISAAINPKQPSPSDTTGFQSPQRM